MSITDNVQNIFLLRCFYAFLICQPIDVTKFYYNKIMAEIKYLINDKAIFKKVGKLTWVVLPQPVSPLMTEAGFERISVKWKDVAHAFV